MAEQQLELESDRSFQKAFWKFQRFAWVAFAIILVLALAGLTGKGGPLSRTTVAGPQGQIEYPRVSRWAMTDELTVTLPPGSASSAVLEMDSDFSRIFQTQDIQPAPKESYATGAGQRLIFELAEPLGQKSITFHVRALQPSLKPEIRMRINDGEPLIMTPVILP